MRTYVTVTLSSEGAPASEVFEKFDKIGFKAALGAHDLVYDWKEKTVTTEMVIELINKVQTELNGSRVRMHFVTIK